MAAPNFWNSLPNDIRNASSLSNFRVTTHYYTFHAKLKTHFLLLHTVRTVFTDEHPLPRLCIDCS